MMTDDQAPAVKCAGCGGRLRPQDVVIEYREIVPSWTLPAEPATTLIFHTGCESEEAAPTTTGRERFRGRFPTCC